MTKKLALFLSIMAAPALAWGSTMEISCVPTACTQGTVTQITPLGVAINAPGVPGQAFDLTNNGSPMSGTAYLAILVPNSPWPAYVTYPGDVFENPGGLIFESGKLGDLFGESNLGDLSFNHLKNASSQASGVDVDFFTAYEHRLGAYNSTGHGEPGLEYGQVTLDRFLAGTVIVGWVEDADDKAILSTNLKNALTYTGNETLPSPTPEPASLLLVGTGLLMGGMAARRRFGKK